MTPKLAETPAFLGVRTLALRPVNGARILQCMRSQMCTFLANGAPRAVESVFWILTN